MALGVFDPYSIYRGLGRMFRGDDREPRDPREHPSGPSGPIKGFPTRFDNYEKGPGQKGEGLKYPITGPPRPSDSDRLAAQAGDENARNIIRAWREWADAKGKWEDEQESGGRQVDRGKGVQAMLDQFGQRMANVDIINRQIGRVHTDPKTGHNYVSWEPMDAQTYNDIMAYRRQVESPRGQKFTGMFGEQYLGNRRMRGVDELVGRGHWSRDAGSGYFYNRGGGTEDPSTWQWFDQFGRKASMPPGFQGGPQAAPGPQGIEGNNDVVVDYGRAGGQEYNPYAGYKLNQPLTQSPTPMSTPVSPIPLTPDLKPWTGETTSSSMTGHPAPPEGDISSAPTSNINPLTSKSPVSVPIRPQSRRKKPSLTGYPMQ